MHKGVFFDNSSKKYRCFIHINNKKIWLGYYGSEDEAIKVRKEAEHFYKGQYKGQTYAILECYRNLYNKGYEVNEESKQNLITQGIMYLKTYTPLSFLHFVMNSLRCHGGESEIFDEDFDAKLKPFSLKKNAVEIVENNEAFRLFLSGESFAEIAKKMGLNKYTMRSYLLDFVDNELSDELAQD